MRAVQCGLIEFSASDFSITGFREKLNGLKVKFVRIKQLS